MKNSHEIYVVTAYRWGAAGRPQLRGGRVPDGYGGQAGRQGAGGAPWGKYSMKIVRCGGRPRNGDNVDAKWRALHLPCPQEGTALRPPPGDPQKFMPLFDDRESAEAWAAQRGTPATVLELEMVP